jgi:hypothetical protein
VFSLLSGNFAVSRLGARFWNGITGTAQAFDVELDGFLHFSLDFFARGAGADAAWEIRRVGGKPGGRTLDHEQIAVHFNPACLRILFRCRAQGRRRACPPPSQARILSDVCMVRTSACAVQMPAIHLDKFNDVTHFHELESSSGLYPRRKLRFRTKVRL